MKLADKWLKEFLATDLSLKQLCEKLTSLGLEVDSVQDWPTLLNNFEVAEVTDVAPHPQADRLSVCKVHTATQTASVVCGASNVRQGLLTIFAPIGAFIPKGAFYIQKTTLRGVESCGMLCSFDELGLGELFPMDKKHIASLPTGTSLDTSVASALELDLDPGFDVVEASGLLGVDALFLPLPLPLLFSGWASRPFSRSDI